MKTIAILILILLFNLKLIAAEACVANLSDLKDNSLVSLEKFGGITGLLGEYKLAGFIGAFAEAQVGFKIKDDKFYVSVVGDKEKQIHICDEDKKLERSHDIHLRVLSPKEPEHGVFLIRSAPNNKIFISGHKSRWRFMTFKKLKKSSPLQLVQRTEDE